MAAANHKLTGLLKGRAISGTSDSGGQKVISFSDGSKMTIQTAPSNANSGSTGGTVDKVRQSVDPPVLYLDLVSGATVEVALADGTSSVLVRDKNDTMEYAD